MEKIVTIISFVIVSVITFAQNAEIYTFESETIGSTDISGTEVDFTFTADGTYKNTFT